MEENERAMATANWHFYNLIATLGVTVIYVCSLLV